MNAHSPAAVLWDMDGTLIDSEPYWIAAEIELCAKFGVAWTKEDGLRQVGNALVKTATELRERGVNMPIDTITEHLTGRVTMQVRERAPWQQDAFDLLNAVLAAGIPCALVTMSYRQLADALLARVPEAFAAVVTGDEVTNGKPDPEAYLLGGQAAWRGHHELRRVRGLASRRWLCARLRGPHGGHQAARTAQVAAGAQPRQEPQEDHRR